MDSLFDASPFVLGFCLWSLLIVLSLLSRLAIILVRSRVLVDLLLLSSRCFVSVRILCLFLTVLWLVLQCMICGVSWSC